MAAISRRIVALLKEHYGKGPTRARTYHMGDLVVVLLFGGYTPVERTLIEDGRSQVVMDQRAAFQQTMRPQFKQVVEEEMRRGVHAFMSTMHHDPDLNVELFLLEAEAAERGTSSNSHRRFPHNTLAGTIAASPVESMNANSLRSSVIARAPLSHSGRTAASSTRADSMSSAADLYRRRGRLAHVTEVRARRTLDANTTGRSRQEPRVRNVLPQLA